MKHFELIYEHCYTFHCSMFAALHTTAGERTHAFRHDSDCPQVSLSLDPVMFRLVQNRGTQILHIAQQPITDN